MEASSTNIETIASENQKRYFIEIAYKGQNYVGWQVQPDKVTVQSTLAAAISTILNQKTKILGCGRTDSGVHASQFFVHFDAPDPLPENFMHRVNKFLPKDIAVKRLITDVPADAHARFDATYRAYDYYVHFDKSPFLYESSFFYPWLPLNLEVMHEAAALMKTYTDFRAFCKTKHASKTFLCDLYEAKWFVDETNNTMRFHIAANRFLRGMVRRTVGCLLMMGKGKISLEEFKHVMDTKKRRFDTMNISAPAEGLYLSEVRYPYISNG